VRRDRLRLIVRASLIAVLVVLLAVTPLSAIFRPAYFEVVFPGSGFVATLRVVVDDRTGLVAGVSQVDFSPVVDEGVSNGPGENGRSLFVTLFGGCGDRLAWLTFDRADNGFVIEERTTRYGCGFLIGISRTVVLQLRAPVDASTVKFESFT
jgi:hypothetical protein